MKLKGFSVVETVLIGLFCFLLFFLLIVLFLKRSWLDELFYGSSFEESVSVENIYEPGYIEEDLSKIEFEVVPITNGLAEVHLILNSDFTVVGVDLFLGKDLLLDISDFICYSPFECLFFGTEDYEVNISAVVSPGAMDSALEGEVLKVGYFEFSGEGNISPKTGTVISTLENAEIHISNSKNFVLK